MPVLDNDAALHYLLLFLLWLYLLLTSYFYCFHAWTQLRIVFDQVKVRRIILSADEYAAYDDYEPADMRQFF